MKRVISFAAAILFAASLFHVGTVPAAATAAELQICPNTPDGKHDYFPFLGTNAPRYSAEEGGYFICTTGCGTIRQKNFRANTAYIYAAGQTITTFYPSYRQATSLPSPSNAILEHNFRFEITKGEQTIALTGAYGHVVTSRKSFKKISRNQVKAICDFGEATFDFNVSPDFPLQWFIIIFGFGWLWY